MNNVVEMRAETKINISPIGVPMLALSMLLEQLEQCRAALADDCETVWLADGKEHDAVVTFQETAESLVQVAAKIAAEAGVYGYIRETRQRRGFSSDD